MLWQSRSSVLDVIVIDESSEARSVGFKLRLAYVRLVVLALVALVLTCLTALLVVLTASRLDSPIAPEAEEVALARIAALEDSLQVQHLYLERLRTVLLGVPEGGVGSPAQPTVTVVRSSGPQVPSFPIQPPVRGIVTRGFAADAHPGVDVAGTLQSSVMAVLPGVVQVAEWTHNGGYTVIVRHPAGYASVYKHLKSMLVRQGQQVLAREPVGLLGSTGTTSTAPHLHFELWHDLAPVNPAYYIAGWSP